MQKKLVLGIIGLIQNIKKKIIDSKTLHMNQGYFSEF